MKKKDRKQYMAMSLLSCCAAISRTGGDRVGDVPPYASVFGAIVGTMGEPGAAGLIPLVVVFGWAASERSN